MSCRECGGNGTLYVLEGYVDQHQPDVADDHPDVISVRAKRASLANTVYPCPECRPELFKRWSAGHMAVAPLGTRSTVPAKARGGRRQQDPLPLEPPGDLDPRDFTMPTRRDLE